MAFEIGNYKVGSTETSPGMFRGIIETPSGGRHVLEEGPEYPTRAEAYQAAHNALKVLAVKRGQIIGPSTLEVVRN